MQQDNDPKNSASETLSIMRHYIMCMYNIIFFYFCVIFISNLTDYSNDPR